MPTEPIHRSNSEAEAVAELAVKAAGAPQILTLTLDSGLKAQVLAVPQHMRVEAIKSYLDVYRERPERKKGTVLAGDLESFIALCQRFQDDCSALFAEPGTIDAKDEGNNEPPTLTAVFNYHEPAHLAETTGEDKDGLPRFGDHRAFYAFPFSGEWKAWGQQNGKPMPQDVFAAFIEDRIADVAAPDAASSELSAFFFERLGVQFAAPSRVMELSRGLSVRVGQKVRNAQNLATGEAQVQFVEEHSDDLGQPLKVPGAFLLAIPVFQFGALYQVAARLRYRVSGGAINWFYELHRADRIFDHAFKEACDTAQNRTALPLFIGSPE